MLMIDMRTLIFNYAISNAVCVLVIALLWMQNRARFAGLGFWLADFVLQFFGIVLVALRGFIPDFFSMVVSNACVFAGTILLIDGLGRFTDKRTSQIRNYILLAIFICVHGYFVFIQPNLLARNVNVAVGIIITCSQAAWLLLFRVDARERAIMRWVGYILLAFCLVAAGRIFLDLFVNPGDDFFHSTVFEGLFIVINQTLVIILTFGLFLVVNRRLVISLEQDVLERRRVESALRLSEERFFKAFHSSPDAITITRMSDGQMVEVNEGFSRLSGYSPEEALSSSTITLNFWANPKDREGCVAALRQDQRIHNAEYEFRNRQGEILSGLYSGEIIQLNDESHILSVVHDITERKRAEHALVESEERFRTLVEQAGDGFELVDSTGRFVDVNTAICQMLGYSRAELLNLSVPEIDPATSPERFAHLFNSLLDKSPATFEGQHRRKDGMVFPVEATASIVSISGELFALALVRDITERKSAEIMKERQRLARDLHDSVNQSLHSVVLLSETLTATLQKDNTKRALYLAERMQDSARQSLKEMRLLLYELQAAETGRETDFVQDLETRLAIVERRAGIQAQINLQGGLENCPHLWNKNLFWITIEALNNTLKHAQARNLEINLRCLPGLLELEISDDGKGFDPASRLPGGLGLRSMRERAALLGGELVIDSSPGKGTRVRFSASIH